MRKAGCYICVALLLSASAFGQWVAFNDHAPGVGTHPNATTFSPGTSGTLKNITNGAAVAASVSITTVSSVAGPIQGVPNYGSPASIVFDGYVNFGGKPNPGIELSGSASMTMTSRPAKARERATARPITPPPTTATSSRWSSLFILYRPVPRRATRAGPSWASALSRFENVFRD